MGSSRINMAETPTEQLPSGWSFVRFAVWTALFVALVFWSTLILTA